MTGIALMFMLLAWLVAAVALALTLTKRFPLPLALLSGALVLCLPFLDELVGKYQFRAACRDGATPRYEEVKLRGRSVHMRQVPYPGLPQLSSAPFRAVPAWIPIEETTVEWLDDQTNEVLLSYKRYVAKVGWLIRALRLSETDAPLTFDPHGCSFNEIPLFRALGVTYR